jgi:Serine/threonine protein kinase
VSGDTERRLGLGLGGEQGGGDVPSAAELAGAIPGLRVIELAGRGGMGAVYRAEQTRLGRVVALKLLPAGATADPMARERFEREARVLAGLGHPRILKIFDFGEIGGGVPYLVTEWAEGGDLAALAGERAQEPRIVAGWVTQIAEALDAAHAKGVVHRDLKPANVLVRGDGGLALGDFGLARAQGAGFTTALTLSGVMYGTADYMAPEQARGGDEVTEAADIYALGVMAYQLLTGRVPRGVFEPASRAAGVARAVDGVIEEALAEDPQCRPKSAGEFARKLERALRRRGTKGGRALVVLGGLAAGVLLAATVFGTKARRGDPAKTIADGEAGVVPEGTAGERPSVLSDVNPEAHAVRGGWARRGEELVVDDEVGLLRLPVKIPADFRYDLVVEFTREKGRHSVGVILPTAAGTGVFEIDAWEQGLGGVQSVNGLDLRSNGLAFEASLRNGERQVVHLVVDGARVGVTWNGVWRGRADLSGVRFSMPEIWEAGAWSGPGLCAWKSPTVFHRVEFFARGG